MKILDDENIQKIIKLGICEDEDSKYIMKSISNLIKKYKHFDIINELITKFSLQLVLMVLIV